MIIALSHNVSPYKYISISRKVADDIGIERFDDTTYEPSRLMYWPYTSYYGEFTFEEIGEKFLDADEVLAKYNNWRNSEELPISSRQNRTIITNIKRQADPLDKKGVVGTFCRTYNITETIDIFLSHIYERTEIDNRCTYILGSSQGGLVIYDEDGKSNSSQSSFKAMQKLALSD